jgi:phosphate transport system substrate-binding protein
VLRFTAMSSPKLLAWISAICLGGLASACSPANKSEPGAPAATALTIRITGSDTMVNLVQAWAENYKKKHSEVSVQVAGGGSGVGFAGLIDGILDLAAASREIEPKELDRFAEKHGGKPKEYAVALDALSVYVHKNNPLDSIALDDLAEIYGDKGRIEKWSQLGVKNTACPGDTIVRVGRQNSSGTYVYFRETVLGKQREYKLGSIDQSGSKDVVALVGRTPCAIGYSGMAYITPEVNALKISKQKGQPAVAPSSQTAIDKSYPLARKLYFYSPGEPKPHVKDFLDWVLSPDGQKIVTDIGFVPVQGATQ